ncbi:MAG: hypothetical protein M5U34_22325 [Chloroflexi bacterium]|nr:hypothetical protein [Chloroflexota bacterium]
MKNEAQFQKLTDQLHRWHGRSLRRDGLLWLPRTLLVGLMLAVVVAVVARQRPFLDNQQVAIVALALGLGGLLVGLLFVFGRRRTIRQQAAFADRQFGLKERVITAVEIHEGVLIVPDEIAQEQIGDTLSATNRVDVKRDLPYRLDRRDWIFLLISIFLLFLAVYLPNPQENILKKDAPVEQAIAEQIEALEAIQQEILENPALSEEQQADLLQPVESALEALQAGGCFPGANPWPPSPKRKPTSNSLPPTTI